MPEVRDFEDDDKKELDRYSPGGVETIIKSSYRICASCDAHCDYLGLHKEQPCWGSVEYTSSGYEHGGIHRCEAHDVKRFTNFLGDYEEDEEAKKLNKRGSNNNWYQSEKTTKE